jgi:protein TonB
MFEDSLLESTGRLRGGTRLPTLASVAVQLCIAAAIVTIPMLHPEKLATKLQRLSSLAPPLPPQPPPPRVHVDTTSMASGPTAPALAPATSQVVRIAQSPLPAATDAPAFDSVLLPMGSGDRSATATISSAPAGPAVSVAPAAPVHVGPMRISKGVSAGLLLAPIQPEYPPLARAARIEGTVTVHAIISKSGRIESATATDGPMMLQGAALNAVRNARYRPFLLNGEPTEVDTTITINFRLGS